jgi:death-on-curing protein
MISLETALIIHHKSIETYGGGSGIRDEGSLLAALGRPWQTFDQQELYASPVDKAAALFESIIINHPFIDGNKRTAYVLLRLTLHLYSLDILADEEEKYVMTIEASCGTIRFDEIKGWISNHLLKIKQ